MVQDYEEHVRKTHVPVYLNVIKPPPDSSGSSRAHSPDHKASSSSADTSATPSLVRDAQGQPYNRSTTQNLSSVLSDPRKTRREVSAFFTRDHGYDFVDKTSIPPPPPSLRPVKPARFADYIGNVGKVKVC